MGFDLLVVAVILACAAAGLAVYCIIVEASEAWDISHRGWARGHRAHAMLTRHRH
ncbi:MAG TPA: hypothetical protein VFU35_11025 [Jatrophihabitans sp.]|nr:hypothetical protein [Jatrophihabitans sp.]